jgi:hypothetical protein
LNEYFGEAEYQQLIEVTALARTSVPGVVVPHILQHIGLASQIFISSWISIDNQIQTCSLFSARSLSLLTVYASAGHFLLCLQCGSVKRFAGKPGPSFDGTNLVL